MVSAIYLSSCELARGSDVDCMFVSEEVILSIFLSQLFKLVSGDTWLFDCSVLQQGLNCLLSENWGYHHESPDTGHCWISGGKSGRVSLGTDSCPAGVLLMLWLSLRESTPLCLPPSVPVGRTWNQTSDFSLSALSTLVSGVWFFFLTNYYLLFLSLLLEEIRMVLFHSLQSFVIGCWIGSRREFFLELVAVLNTKVTLFSRPSCCWWHDHFVLCSQYF